MGLELGEAIHPYLLLQFPQGQYRFVLLPSLLFTYSILYFVRSSYCSSCSFLLSNELLFYLLAVFPSSLMRLFPSSVHLANTQQVLRFNSQHSASYCAGSGFEVVCSAWTLSSSFITPFCRMPKSALWTGHNHFFTVLSSYSPSHFGHNLCST